MYTPTGLTFFHFLACFTEARGDYLRFLGVCWGSLLP
jgi:hypothetical protein